MPCRSSADFLPLYMVIVGGLGELMRIVPSGQGQCSPRGETRAPLSPVRRNDMWLPASLERLIRAVLLAL